LRIFAPVLKHLVTILFLLFLAGQSATHFIMPPDVNLVQEAKEKKGDSQEKKDSKECLIVEAGLKLDLLNNNMFSLHLPQQQASPYLEHHAPPPDLA
jgi:hypothetical protein